MPRGSNVTTHCGGAVALGGGAVGFPHLHIPSIGEMLPLAVVTALFVAAGVWLFRRFGEGGVPATAEASPETLEQVLAEFDANEPDDPAEDRQRDLVGT